MKTEKFVKVFIEGKEENLPKESGKYQVMRTIYDHHEEYKELPFTYDESFHFLANHGGYRDTWLEKVKWYLQSVIEDEELTDKQIEKWAINDVHQVFHNSEYSARVIGAKAYRDGTIQKWLDLNNKGL